MDTVQPMSSPPSDAAGAPMMQEPAPSMWPYWAPSSFSWRNGREAGAHAAGLVCASPEKCGLVEFPKDWADGGVLALVAASLSVEGYSEGESTRTFKVRASWLVWESWQAE